MQQRVFMRPALCLIAVFAFAAFACNRAEDKPAATTTTTGASLESDFAVMRVTNARCDRAVECNSVGSGRKFLDRDQCTRELGNESYTSLRAENCPAGINEDSLSSCLATLRNARCDGLSSELPMTCRRAQLCVSY